MVHITFGYGTLCIWHSYKIIPKIRAHSCRTRWKCECLFIWHSTISANDFRNVMVSMRRRNIKSTFCRKFLAINQQMLANWMWVERKKPLEYLLWSQSIIRNCKWARNQTDRNEINPIIFTVLLTCCAYSCGVCMWVWTDSIDDWIWRARKVVKANYRRKQCSKSLKTTMKWTKKKTIVHKRRDFSMQVCVSKWNQLTFVSDANEAMIQWDWDVSDTFQKTYTQQRSIN